jgi:hypothetical protein
MFGRDLHFYLGVGCALLTALAVAVVLAGATM